MKFLTSITAVSLAVLLTACGGTDPDNGTSFGSTGVMVVQAAGAGNAFGQPPAQGPNDPQPDCAPEGCNSLRIIDANAEAYRLDAMQRAEREAQQAGA